MKKAFPILLLLVLLCIGFISCGSTDDKSISQITSVTLGFETDGENFRRVKIDFLEEKKTIIDYLQESYMETVVEYSTSEQLVKYLMETVIPCIDSNPQKQITGEEEALVWHIKIVADGANYVASGVGDEPFPKYWETLLVLLEN